MQVLFLSFLAEKVSQPGILPMVFFLLTALSALCRFCYRKEKKDVSFKSSKWITETANNKTGQKQDKEGNWQEH